MNQRGVDVFLGVPFALAPTRGLRWRSPQKVPPWAGIRTAKEFAASCPQALSTPTQLAPLGATSEDCLFLNVWTPHLRHGVLPVMVYIHGGGFIAGSGAEAELDGAQLAGHGVVVVTFNYRLGRLGFFAHPALERESPGEAHGNYGLMDQLAALRWVQVNIGSFGGDPKNVTIFGESAGGMSIVALLNIPDAGGLFSKAIIESGAIHRPIRNIFVDQPGVASAETLGTGWAKKLGIAADDPNAMSSLRALPAETVAPPMPSLPEVMEILEGSGPMVDGRLLPDSPNVAFEGKVRWPVPMVIGSNGRECFVWSFGPQVSVIPIISMNPKDLLRGLDAGEQELLLAESRQDRSVNDAEPMGALASDALLGMPTLKLAQAVAPSAPVFLYRFTALPGPVVGLAREAPHGTEIFSVFGTLDRFPYRPDLVTAADRKLSAQMMQYWTSFARTGTPKARGAPLWRTFEPKNPSLLLFAPAGVHQGPVPRLDSLRVLAAASAQR